jgi:hypothetical protein
MFSAELIIPIRGCMAISGFVFDTVILRPLRWTICQVQQRWVEMTELLCFLWTFCGKCFQQKQRTQGIDVNCDIFIQILFDEKLDSTIMDSMA